MVFHIMVSDSKKPIGINTLTEFQSKWNNSLAMDACNLQIFEPFSSLWGPEDFPG